MRKNLFLGGVALIVAMASVVITVYENEKNVPDLFDANIEALTSDEVIIQRPCVYYPSRICYILDDDLGYTEVKGYLY